jgi:NAD(P)-dependent dehydrogenase (short-subunit alcohol dehydrogenase family)
MADTYEFSGRSALITAGTRSIGKGIADRLRAGGARVVVAARSVPDRTSDDVIAADVSTADGVAVPRAAAHLHPLRCGEGRVDQLQQGAIE